jgi:hypothetical protein
MNPELHDDWYDSRFEPIPTLTASYPFASLSVGNYFTVLRKYQHARVAASEYGRKNGMVFSCRMQEDRSMRVYRVAKDQEPVDKRGRHGRRRIDTALHLPTQTEFDAWLGTFKAGQSFAMPITYRAQFLLMQAWASLYSIHSKQEWKTGNNAKGELMLTRVN